jgi:peptide/nickel transport system permease protein
VGQPAFWVGILLLYTFGFLVRLFPLGGYGGLHHLVLPALTVGIVNGPWYARMFRSSMLDVLGADFLRTAHAKGLATRMVLRRHALPNAIRPIVTMLGIDMGHFLGGLLVVETVFAWPGLGQLLYDAVLNLDIPIIIGTVLFSSVMVGVANLFVDLSYPLFDPRLKFG